MIIIILISGVYLISYSTNNSKSNPSKTLAKNYEIEFLNLSQNNPTPQDINGLNYYFKKFINSNNFDSKICNILESGEHIILSNYTDSSCNILINGDNNGTLAQNSTTTIDRFINNTNIYLCSCYYESGKNIYYIDIYNENSKTILKN